MWRVCIKLGKRRKFPLLLYSCEIGNSAEKLLGKLQIKSVGFTPYFYTYPRYKHGISTCYISNMKIVYLRIVNFEIVYYLSTYLGT